MIVAGIITAVVFVIALSRSAGLADRKMEEINMLSAAREAESLYISSNCLSANPAVLAREKYNKSTTATIIPDTIICRPSSSVPLFSSALLPSA